MASKCLSLRLVLFVSITLSILVVVVISLSLTIASGVSRLHDLGLAQSHVLLASAETQVSNFVGQTTSVLSQLGNQSLTQAYDRPADNVTVRDSFFAMAQAAFVANRGAVSELILYWPDSTALKLRHVPWFDFYDMEQQRASPFADFPNQTVENRCDVYSKTTMRRVDPSSMADASGIAEQCKQPIFSKQQVQGGFYFLMDFTRNGTVGLLTNAIAVKVVDRIDMQLVAAAGMFTAAAPINPEHPQVSDVFAFGVATTSITALTLFLRGLRSINGMALVVYDQDGFLMGSSADEEVPFLQEYPADESVEQVRACTIARTIELVAGENAPWVCRRHIADYPVPMVQRLVKSGVDLNSEVSLVELRQGQGFDATFVGISPVVFDLSGLTAFIAIAVPDEEILGSVVTAYRISIGCAVGVGLLLAVLNAVVVWRLLKPLDRVAQRMEKAANLEDDGAYEEISRLSEVSGLQVAYFNMNEELCRIRSFVPEAVLFARRQERRGDFESDDEESLVDEESVTSAPTSARIVSFTSTTGPTSNSPSQPKPFVTSPNIGRGLGNTPRSGGGSKGPSFTRHQSGAMRMSPRNHSGLGVQRNTTPRGSIRSAAVGGSSGGGSGQKSTSSGGGATRMTQVTVLAANIERFHAALFESRHLAVEELCNIIGHAEEVTKQNSGVLTFHGDRLLATFNAAKNCPAHGRKALEAAVALSLEDPVGKLGCRIRCGVATGPCVTGNLGSAGVKTFSTMGPAFTQAIHLERLAPRYGTGCHVLASQRTCAEAQGQFRMAYVDLVAMKGRDSKPTPMLVAAVLPPTAGMNNESMNNEWLYVVDSTEKSRNSMLEPLLRGTVHASLIDGHPSEWPTHPTSVTDCGIADNLESIADRARQVAQDRDILRDNGRYILPSDAVIQLVTPQPLI